MTSALAAKALAIAISRIGVKENPIGSNWGHPVQDYLARVKTHTPAPWCMAFVYTCFDDAAQELGMPCPLICTPGVLDAWHRAGDLYKFVVDAGGNLGIQRFPQPGDIFLMDLGGGKGHCGIIEMVTGYPDLGTIDGNTNAEGGREGFEVERKTRHDRKPIIGYLRY